MAERQIDLEASWLSHLSSEFDKPYMQELRSFLQAQKRAGKRIFPRGNEFFNAFAHTPLGEVKVVILGQDPYHGEGQAHGLCFSVRKGERVPPSLRNIYKELHQTTGFHIPDHGELTPWARQGVLLLNTVLTVRAHQANSHRGKGWEVFTDRVIDALNHQREGLVFVLWGASAGKKARRIDGRRHLILRAPHPSPLSAHRGFFGSGHFVRINEHLVERGEAPASWAL